VFVVSVEDKQGEIKQQIVEAHRCVNPADAKQGDGWSDGFRFGAYGEVLEYNFRMDDGADRKVPAEKVRHISKATRASAAHGLPPLAQALNTMDDQAQIFEMEKTAVRDVSDIPRVITKAGGTLDPTTAAEVTGNGGNPYDDISRKMGGKLLVLDTGEKLEYPVPTRGTNVWIGFNDALQRMICAGGLPYEFVHDSTKAGSGTIRMTLGKAGRYVGAVQTMLIEDDLTPSWNEIIAKGRDASNDREDLKLGLTSFTELYKRRAAKFETDSEQLARDIAWLRDLEQKYKLPVNTLSQRYNTLPFNDQQITSITEANPEPLQQ
jgi:capsid protein